MVARGTGPMVRGVPVRGVTYALASPCSETSPRRRLLPSTTGMFRMSYSSISDATSTVGIPAGALFVNNDGMSPTHGSTLSTSAGGSRPNAESA